MKRIPLTALLILLFSCRSFEPDFEYVFITPDPTEKEYLLPGYQRYFDLTNQDLERAERLLEAAFKEYKKDTDTDLTKEALKAAKRQYVSYVNGEGHKIIWINGLCRVLEEPVEVAPDEYEFKPWDWKNKIIRVNDGGSCYWQADINLETGTGLLRVNGI